MTDFLSALSRRAVLPPAVRPRAPSRFEPLGPERAAAPADDVAASAPEPPSPPAARSAAAATPAEVAMPRPPVWPELPPRGGWLREDVTAPRPVVAAASPVPRTEAAESELGTPILVLPLAPVGTPVVRLPVAPVARLEVPFRETVGERISSEIRVHSREVVQERFENRVERILLEPVPARPNLAALGNTSPRLEAAPAEPPRLESRHVEINIGRIEIIAAGNSAEPARVTSAKRADPQSLEHYLSDRAQGYSSRGRRA